MILARAPAEYARSLSRGAARCALARVHEPPPDSPQCFMWRSISTPTLRRLRRRIRLHAQRLSAPHAAPLDFLPAIAPECGRERARRDITVPIGTLVTSAIWL